MNLEHSKKSTTEYKTVNKAIKSYAEQLNKISTYKVESRGVTYSSFLKDKMLIILAIRNGIPYNLFNKIKDLTPFSEDEWANFLSLSKKTLYRHSNEVDYVFKPIHSEKIIEIAEVIDYGKEVFDTTEQFYLWLSTPSFALGNLKPSELLKNSYGKEMVKSELTKIENGIFA